MKDVKDNETYSADEFFYDTSFEDYDIQAEKRHAVAFKKKLEQIGLMIQVEMIVKEVSVDALAEYLKLSIDAVCQICEGNYKDIDLRIISQVETLLDVKIIEISEE